MIRSSQESGTISNIRKLYLFHALNSIALGVVAHMLFIDKIFLRMGLNMSQFGFIKGISFFLPVTINLLLTPLILRLRMDHKIVAVAYLIRVILPYFFLILPKITHDTSYLAFGCTIVLLTSLIFPTIANNSIQVLCKMHIPKETLGKHSSMIRALWDAPGTILGILCGWYIDRFDGANDAQFYSAYLVIFLATTVFQVLASWVIWQLKPLPAEDVESEIPVKFKDILEPFLHTNFRVLLNTVFLTAILTSMVNSFIFPYLLQARGLSMFVISAIIAILSILGFILFPLWGRITDRFGGKNVFRTSVLGVAIGLFCLTGTGLPFVVVYFLLAGLLFGAGLTTGEGYLVLSLSDKTKSNIYIAAITFVSGCGILVGSAVGGLILEWLKTKMHPDFPFEQFKIYFTYCAFGYLLLGGFVAGLKDGREKVSPVILMQEAYRTFRSCIWRTR